MNQQNLCVMEGRDAELPWVAVVEMQDQNQVGSGHMGSVLWDHTSRVKSIPKMEFKRDVETHHLWKPVRDDWRKRKYLDRKWGLAGLGYSFTLWKEDCCSQGQI